MVLGGSPGAVNREFYARNIVAALVAVHALIEGLAIHLTVNDLVLIEKVLIGTAVHLTAKFQTELLIGTGISLGVVGDGHLDLIALAVGGEVEAFGIVNVDIQAVVIPLIGLIGIAIFYEADDLHLSGFVEGIVPYVEGLSVHGGGEQVIQYVGIMKAAAVTRPVGGGAEDPEQSHQHHHQGGHAEQRTFLNCSCMDQNSITSLSRMTPRMDSVTVKWMRTSASPL